MQAETYSASGEIFGTQGGIGSVLWSCSWKCCFIFLCLPICYPCYITRTFRSTNCYNPYKGCCGWYTNLSRSFSFDYTVKHFAWSHPTVFPTHEKCPGNILTQTLLIIHNVVQWQLLNKVFENGNVVWWRTREFVNWRRADPNLRIGKETLWKQNKLAAIKTDNQNYWLLIPTIILFAVSVEVVVMKGRQYLV